MEKETRLRFSEICTAVDLMDIDNENTHVIPNKLRGFARTPELRDALIKECVTQFEKKADDWCVKLALALIETARMYDEFSDEEAEDILHGLCLSAIIYAMLNQTEDTKVKQLQILFNIITASYMFDKNIPTLAYSVLFCLMTDAPPQVLRDVAHGEREDAFGNFLIAKGLIKK